MCELSERQKAIFAALREFAVRHTHGGKRPEYGGDYWFDDERAEGDIEIVLQRIDQARLLPDEPAEQEPEEGFLYGAALNAFRGVHGEDFSFDKCVIDSKSKTVTFWSHHAWEQRNEHLRQQEPEPGEEDEQKELRRGLVANLGQFVPLIGAVHFGRYLGDMADSLKKSAEADLFRALMAGYAFIDRNPGEHPKEVVGPLQRIADLLSSFAGDEEESEEPAPSETLKKLAGFNVEKSGDVFKVYLPESYFEELLAAIEKGGGDLTYWRQVMDHGGGSQDAKG